MLKSEIKKNRVEVNSDDSNGYSLRESSWQL